MKSFFLSLGFFFFLLCAGFGPTLWHWSLSGDDVSSLVKAQSLNSVPKIAHSFVDFSHQYRPLTYLFFKMYLPLLPNFRAIFFLNLLFFSLVPTLLFLSVKKALPWPQALMLVSATMLSGTFFYHIFTISGLVNTLMLILFSLQCFVLTHRSKYTIPIAFLVFFLSIFVKENFLPIFALFLVALFLNNAYELKQKIFYGLISTLIVAIYFFLHVIFYEMVDVGYQFVFSFQQLKTNLLLLLPWLVQYPRGWQYGTPILIETWRKIATGMYIVFLVAGAAHIFFRRKISFLGVVLLLLSTLVPFFFLSRVLVYYVDSAQVTLLLIVCDVISFMNEKSHQLGTVAAALFLFIACAQSLTLLPVWTKHSFVADANTAAQTFAQTLHDKHVENYQVLCLIHEDNGGWATDHGQLAQLLGYKHLLIVSTFLHPNPPQCDWSNALIL